jgi:hypothetical protein
MLDWLVDHRTALPSVGHQGRRSTCLSWAITAAHEFATGGSPLSVEFQHWNSGSYAGGRGNILAASMALKTEGQPPNSQWEYMTVCDERSPAYSPSSSVIGPFRKADADIGVLDVSSIISILQSNRLPIVALRITDAFLGAKGGVVERDGAGQDGHAVVAVGAAHLIGTEQVGTVKPGERLICLRNSWGTNWGVNGHCLMPETAIRECGLGIIGLQPIVV